MSESFLSDVPAMPAPFDKVALWVKRFKELGADPLALIGSLPDGTPIIAAVETLNGEPFELRQLLTDILVRVGDR